MSSIFHYTNIQGLIGILETGCLFATDYRFLNDFTEGTSLHDHLVPIFEEEIRLISPQLIKSGMLKQKYYDDQGLGVDRQQAEIMYNCFVKAIDNVGPFFVSSFCKHDVNSKEYENGLLSQWRGYTESGGVAIEFDEVAIDKLVALEVQKFAYVGYKTADTEYFDISKICNLSDFRGVAGEMIWKIFNNEGLDVSHITGRTDFDAAAKKFIEAAPFVKHWGFHEELEYRIVMICYRRGKAPTDDERKYKEIKFRQRGGLAVPYIELFNDIDSRLPIKSVIVGPHPLQERQEQAVQILVETKGFEIEVRRSAIPYRR